MQTTRDYSKFIDVGLIFEKRRIELGMDIETIAENLKISQEILMKIESGDVQNILDKIYYEGVVTKYAGLVGLKSDKILSYISTDIKLFGRDNERRIMSLRYQGKEKKDTISMRIIFIIAAVCAVILVINTAVRKNQAVIKVSEYLGSDAKY